MTEDGPRAEESSMIPLGKLNFTDVSSDDEEGLRFRAEVTSLVDGSLIGVEVVASREHQPPRDLLGSLHIGFAVPLIGVKEASPGSSDLTKGPALEEEPAPEPGDVVIEVDFSEWEDPGAGRDLGRSGVLMVVDPPIGFNRKHFYRAKKRDGEVVFRNVWIRGTGGRVQLSAEDRNETVGANERTPTLSARTATVIGMLPSSGYEFFGHFWRVK